MQSTRTLKIAFWTLAAAGLAVILWKFIGSQEQPMEGKILVVFATFAAGAFAFRGLRRRSQDTALNRWLEEAIEWSDTGISAVLLAFVIMSFVVQAFKIPSSSMKPTLQIGDHLFVNKFVYGAQLPFTLKRLWRGKAVQRFDVVVFLCPPSALSDSERRDGVKKDFIKRAVGLPGDTIEVRNKALLINGRPLDDPHAAFSHPVVYPRPAFWRSREEYQKGWESGEFASLPVEAVRDNFGPVRVPEHAYFVLGDNRDGSFDSRFWGPLDEKYLKGRAWLVYWPFRRSQKIR